ncbi:unnamed protein product [Chrysodeixis includens]|uniref:DUF4371 domain-containing protein n=1 Tax=Chrysodeixis includens TaxID=689277 RepID=A0A9N8KSZ2_CHRIL|nr:unnamed protein product [Chrysodeixis includens]
MLFDCEVCVDNVCLLKIINKKFSQLSFSEKIQIICKGRCVPELQFHQQKGNIIRRFHAKTYETFNWLCGCVHTNRLYCFPCILFSTSSTVWTDSGYSDLNNFHSAAKKHEHTEKHLEACLKLNTFGKSLIETSVNNQLRLDIESHNAKVDRNRKVFQRLIDVVCFLGKQELSFRGDDELNKGNYLEIVHLLAKYDGVLDTHLQSASTSFTGMSNRTQNDLISSVASVMIDRVKTEIKESDFVAVMVDETPDVSGREQLVIVLRYFRDSEIVDRFIKYVDINADRTAVTLSSIILEILEEFDCLSKLVAQTYDGAAVLSSQIDGVQALVKEKCPQAMHVWCSAHILNLVLSKSFERVHETKRFFSIVKSIAAFFHTSAKRMAHYNNFADMRKLPRVAETGWAYHSRTVTEIYNASTHLLELFENMNEYTQDWDGETLTLVSSFLFNMKEFEFNFLLKIFADIFAETHVLYGILQQKSNIAYCVEKIKELESILERYRDKFEIYYDAAVHITGPPKRKHNVDDVKIHYQRIFLEIIDNVNSELRNRYKNLKDLKFIEILSCENFKKYSEIFPENKIREFTNNYQDHFDFDKLKPELRCFYKSPQFANSSVFSIIQNLYDYNLDTVFTEVLRLAKFIVTIPASSESAECSFSCLKHIHTYLRNTQNQQRLTELSMISIEKTLMMELKRSRTFYDDVLNSYLEKDMCIDLIYK